MHEALLQRLGEHQHALVTTPQLRTAGMTGREIDGMVARGRLVRMHRGIHRLAGAPITWNQQMLAACLATRGSSSHRASSLVWGVELGPTPPFEVTVSGDRAPRRPGVIVHRSRDLTPDQVMRRHGIPTTKPLRMLVDLGAVASPADVELAIDSLTSRKIVTIEGIRNFRERLGASGRDGAGVLGDVLANRALGTRRADGMLEPVMSRLLRSQGLPPAEFQVRVLVDGEWRRLDFAYVPLMIDIEVDGYENHGGKYESWEDDLTRDNELRLLGWIVLRFSWNQVRKNPGYVARTIRRALAEREAAAS